MGGGGGKIENPGMERFYHSAVVPASKTTCSYREIQS